MANRLAILILSSQYKACQIVLADVILYLKVHNVLNLILHNSVLSHREGH